MRIVSLLPAATDWVCTLGAGEQLVGCSHACSVAGTGVPILTRPSFSVEGDSSAIDSAVRGTLQAGLSLYEIDVDALTKSRPDIVLTQAQCEVCASSLSQLEEMLSTWTGTRPHLFSMAPTTLKQVLDVGLRLGRLLGRLQEAMAFISAQERNVQQLRQQLGLTALEDHDLPTVACIEWLEPLMTAGHWMPDLVALAGGRAVLAEKGASSSTIEWEQLRAADPDVLLIMPCGFRIEETRRDLQYLTGRMEWKELTAVQTGRVYVFDGKTYFNRPGPSIYRALQLVAFFLHGKRGQFDHLLPEPWEAGVLEEVVS